MDDVSAAMMEGAMPPAPAAGDPALADALMSAGPPPPPAFPSTSPDMIAMAVQEALARLMDEDHAMLQMQQQQALMMAQPVIDEIVGSVMAPPPPMPMDQMAMMPPEGPPVDPMVAYGEGSLPAAPGLM